MRIATCSSDKTVVLSIVKSNNCSVICREQGVVVVKGSGSGSVTVVNGGHTTTPGTYVDEITGNVWTVSENSISGIIGKSGISVLYKQWYIFINILKGF